MEKLIFDVIISEELFSDDASRKKAGFSHTTDPDEYFKVIAEVDVENNKVKFHSLSLFSYDSDELGRKIKTTDITELINPEIKSSIALHIVEYEW